MLKGFLRYIQGPVFFKADEIEILKGEKLKDQRPKAWCALVFKLSSLVLNKNIQVPISVVSTSSHSEQRS